MYDSKQVLNGNRIKYLFIFRIFLKFKTRSRVLVRDAGQPADSFLSASLHILAERISDGGLTPTTDTNLLLATYRSGSHLTSDIFLLPDYSFTFIMQIQQKHLSTRIVPNFLILSAELLPQSLSPFQLIPWFDTPHS